MGFLEDIVESTRSEVERRRRAVPIDRLLDELGPVGRGRPFSEALIAPGVSLIAEMKRASPSRGPIRPDASVTDIVRMYEAAGASACSILTEPAFFGGSLDDLREARSACSLPLLRKDFIVDEYQLVEARLDELVLVDDEVLPKQRQGARRPRLPQIVEASAEERGLRQDRARRRARRLVHPDDVGDARVRADRPAGRARPLHLRDQGHAGRDERLRERPPAADRTELVQEPVDRDRPAPPLDLGARRLDDVLEETH